MESVTFDSHFPATPQGPLHIPCLCFSQYLGWTVIASALYTMIVFVASLVISQEVRKLKLLLWPYLTTKTQNI